MILNWAFLVPRNVTADLCARIDRANAECTDFELVFELSGPWPPYSFCPILEAETQAMSFLLYCIFQTRMNQEPPHLSGANNIWPVLFITANNLSAAVSRVGRSDLTPDTSRMLAYEKIIALLHRDFTVIPMRYGCVLEEESQIIRLLESRCEAYTALLSELEGCVEIGIRALPGCEESYRMIPKHPLRIPWRGSGILPVRALTTWPLENCITRGRNSS